MRYKGVSFHPRDRLYAPRVSYNNKWVWLKTFGSALDAAMVRDCAERWIHAGNAKLNFKDRRLPDGTTEASVARVLVDSRIPLSFLSRRIPLDVLRAAGVTSHELILAGIPIEKALATA